jgi:hypothetical protein
MKRPSLAFASAAILAAVLSVAPAASAPPALAVRGAQFTVDGTPRFLLLVSYFDALRASDATLNADFAWLRRQRIDGVRIFPNWWRCAAERQCGGHPGPDTLFAPGGQVRPAPLARLRRVLATAASHGLVVDVSFARETVLDGNGRPMAASAYAGAIARTLDALAATAPHAMFDLQNETDQNRVFAREPAADAKGIGTLTKRLATGRRILFASTVEDQAALLLTCGQPQGCGADGRPPDVVAVHDPRVPNWWTRTSEVVEKLRGIMAPTGQRPIYLQEPQAWQDEAAAERRRRFLEAAAAARRAGAAAWTFHTRSAFVLRDGRSLTAQLDADQRAAIEGLREGVDGAR